LDFYQNLDSKVQEKIEYVFYIIRNIEIIPSKFIKSLKGTEGLYEIRIQAAKNTFRIFCFFDNGCLVVLLHGIQKKSQKIPKKEINRAEKLRQEYFCTKDKSHE
jgi:phage-related protein